MRKPVIYFTVTNNLNYDQRMIRICSTLANVGYEVHLVGSVRENSPAIKEQNFQQHRIPIKNHKGKLFYVEFNYKLYKFLGRKKMDAICAIDLDTILPVYRISKKLNIPRIYDSHELFCEMKEIVTRPGIHKFWKAIEKFALPKFEAGYTVNEPIAKIYKEEYGVDYAVVKNVPKTLPISTTTKQKFILCQGAVNEARCFETLVPAMQQIDYPLIVCGDGNFLQQAKALAKQYKVENKITFTGMLPPEKLKEYTANAYLGLTLIEDNGQSNYLSLANRFFDYVQGGTPQICVDFPAYKNLNNQFGVARLIGNTHTETLVQSINTIMEDEAAWHQLHLQCLAAAKVWNWENEQQTLIDFYKNLLG